MGRAPEFLRGVYAPITTPFTDDGQLSTDNLERNIKMWLLSPLDGFVVLGSTGEFPLLTFDEKLQVIEAAVNAAEERPVIAGTGCNSTAETVALTLAAAERGADAVIVITPYYFRGAMRPSALEQHYTTIADQSPVPVLLYNFPQNTGVDLSLELVAELAQHPNIVGIKDSGGDMIKLGRLIDAVPEGFQVFTGAAPLLLHTLLLGGAGGILAIANVAPWECGEIYRLYREGQHEAAAEVQRRLNAVAAAVGRHGVAGIKALMQMLGYYGGPPRPPLEPVEPEELDAIRGVLKEVRMLGC
ncbi:MAG TPA: 4-hydroxy-tetrahydrodipicolinate synthase [Bacillota bacterium]